MSRKKPAKEPTYWPPFYRRVLYFGFGLFLIILSVAITWNMLSAVEVDGQMNSFSWLFLILIWGCGVGLIMSAIRFRLTLTSRELTLHRALYTRTIQREEILGYRIYNPHQGGTQNVLYLHTARASCAALSVSLEFDDNAPLLRWIDGIPDLARS